MNRINPDDWSTVPAADRATVSTTAVRLADHALSLTDNMQMLIDLLALAKNDGCVAAGWAYELITKPKEQ